jgi:hypothetical protein
MRPTIRGWARGIYWTFASPPLGPAVHGTSLLAPEGRPRCCVGVAAHPNAEQQKRPTDETRGTTGRPDRRTPTREAARSRGPPQPRAPTPIGRSCGAAPPMSMGRTAQHAPSAPSRRTHTQPNLDSRASNHQAGLTDDDPLTSYQRR